MVNSRHRNESRRSEEGRPGPGRLGSRLSSRPGRARRARSRAAAHARVAQLSADRGHHYHRNGRRRLHRRGCRRPRLESIVDAVPEGAPVLGDGARSGCRRRRLCYSGTHGSVRSRFRSRAANATWRSRCSVSARSRRGSPRRSASRLPACWSICAPMSASASPRTPSWPASTTASSARRSPARQAAVEQAAANLQKAAASVEKAKANYANAKTISERRQKLVQSKVTSVETAQTAQAAQDAALADLRPGEQRSRWWPRPRSATPRRNSSCRQRRWIFTRSPRPMTPW